MKKSVVGSAFAAVAATAGVLSVLGCGAVVSKDAAAPVPGYVAPVSVSAEPAKWIVLASSDTQGDRFELTVREAIEAAAGPETEVEVLGSNTAFELSSHMTHALEERPEVIIALGSRAVTEVEYASAENLDQPFVLVDAQPAEATDNLTSVLFEAANCPTGASCVAADDVVDVGLLGERTAADVAQALEATIAEVREGAPGEIRLYQLEG